LEAKVKMSGYFRGVKDNFPKNKNKKSTMLLATFAAFSDQFHLAFTGNPIAHHRLLSLTLSGFATRKAV
jgi:hypothetical protein